MTPCEIEVMLHHYYCVEPMKGPDGNGRSQAQEDAINTLLGCNMIHPSTPQDHKKYGTEYVATPRGKAYVEMLCQTPFPEIAWIDPRTNRVVEGA